MCPFEPWKPVAASQMQAVPTVVWLRPVSSDALVGGAQRRGVELRVAQAAICQPIHCRRLDGATEGRQRPKTGVPHTMNNTFGAPAGALGCSYGSQSETESRTSIFMVPLNCLDLLHLFKKYYKNERWCPLWRSGRLCPLQFI